ncbi:MAG: AEC family transporter [Alphaproteobacteria bacterium]|nr:AEC family transporter [Alphaproteobacteria bacterium]
MPIVLEVLQIVAPVFLLGGIGFIWVRVGGEYRVEFVTKLAMNLGVPSLIFVSLMQAKVAPAALSEVVLAAVASYAALSVAAFVLVRLFRLPVQTYLAPIIFGNTGNLGLPLALFAFGEAGLGYAVVIFAVMAIYSFTFGVWLVSGGQSLTKVLKEPIVYASLLGGLFLFQGWSTPLWLTNALELTGQMAIPLMLITLGVAVARLHLASIGRAVLLSILKSAISILIAVMVGRWLELPPIAFAVLVLQISTPVAVTSYLLAERYQADAQSVAGLVVVSTVVSILVIPVTLVFLL